MPVINGHYIHVERSGAESTHAVVLLHHGLGSTHSWREQIRFLKDYNLPLIAYDRWGYGQSEHRKDVSIPSFQDDIHDLSTLLEIEGVKHALLVGHSDGGTIGLSYAAENPAVVSGLVTIAAHIYVEEKMVKGINDIYRQYIGDARFRGGLERMHGEKSDEVFFNWYNGWNTEEVMIWDLRELITQIRCPVLVIQGIEDEHAIPQHAQDIAASIPDAKLWLAQGEKHMLPQEAPEKINQKLINFIQQINFS